MRQDDRGPAGQAQDSLPGQEQASDLITGWELISVYYIYAVLIVRCGHTVYVYTVVVEKSNGKAIRLKITPIYLSVTGNTFETSQKHSKTFYS